MGEGAKGGSSGVKTNTSGLFSALPAGTPDNYSKTQDTGLFSGLTDEQQSDYFKQGMGAIGKGLTSMYDETKIPQMQFGGNNLPSIYSAPSNNNTGSMDITTLLARLKKLGY